MDKEGHGKGKGEIHIMIVTVLPSEGLVLAVGKVLSGYARLKKHKKQVNT